MGPGDHRRVVLDSDGGEPMTEPSTTVAPVRSMVALILAMLAGEIAFPSTYTPQNG